MKVPIVSVVIPTFCRYGCLKETCVALIRQNYKDFEIIVIDQTSESQRENFEMAGVDVLHQKDPSASAARNLGLREASGEIVLFLDDDVIIEDREFLVKHQRHYLDPQVVGVAGAAPDVGQDICYERHRFFRERGLGWAYFPSNQGCQAWLRVGRSNNLSVRRKEAIDCGGMDEQYEKGAHREEADFCLRLTTDGGRIIFDPFASLVHIGNAQGGIRSWQQGETVKALHHMVGDLYLLRRQIPLSQWPEYLALSLRYFVFPRGIATPVKHWSSALRRWLRAWGRVSIKLQEGPKMLNLRDRSSSSSAISH